MRGITPYLQVRNTGDAIAWYERVFGATEVRARLVAPDGTCMNPEIEIAWWRRSAPCSKNETMGRPEVVVGPQERIMNSPAPLFRNRAHFTLIIIVLALSGCTKGPNRLLYEELSKLAEQGNSEAQYHVGMMLNNGLGVNRDLPKAFEWFQKAAAAGDPLAAYKVGCFWGGQFPDVVSIDEQKSLEYKLIAAKAGYDLAQHDVALWYYQHEKSDEVLRWLKLSAEQGSDRALFALSSLYREGKIVPNDSVLAYEYLMLGKAESEQPFPKEGQAILDQLKSDLSPAQLDAANDAIAAWKPQPTALTIRARSGVDEARRLAASSGQ